METMSSSALLPPPAPHRGRRFFGGLAGGGGARGGWGPAFLTFGLRVTIQRFWPALSAGIGLPIAGAAVKTARTILMRSLISLISPSRPKRGPARDRKSDWMVVIRPRLRLER